MDQPNSFRFAQCRFQQKGKLLARWALRDEWRCTVTPTNGLMNESLASFHPYKWSHGPLVITHDTATFSMTCLTQQLFASFLCSSVGHQDSVWVHPPHKYQGGNQHKTPEIQIHHIQFLNRNNEYEGFTYETWNKWLKVQRFEHPPQNNEINKVH